MLARELSPENFSIGANTAVFSIVNAILLKLAPSRTGSPGPVGMRFPEIVGHARILKRALRLRSKRTLHLERATPAAPI
jgi:hypothetical protein